MTTKRPKDGMYSRFTGPVMDQLCALVPDFTDHVEALKFFKRMTKYKRFQTMIEESRTKDSCIDNMPTTVSYVKRSYRCTEQPRWRELELGYRKNPMELMHIVAHYLQPGGNTPWHGGEFGSIFLELIERMFGKDTKRAAKDILVSNKIKTSVRSPETREKQAAAFYRRKIEKAPEGLLKILRDTHELQRTFQNDDD